MEKSRIAYLFVITAQLISLSTFADDGGKMLGFCERLPLWLFHAGKPLFHLPIPAIKARFYALF